MRSSVHPNVGHRIQPVANLTIQIVQARELPDAGPEVLTEVADSVFDLAFGSGAVRPAVSQHKSVVVGKAGKPFIPDGMPPFVKARDNGLHVVVQDHFRPSAKVLECPQMAANEGIQLFVLRKLHIHHAGISQDHDEGIHPLWRSMPVYPEPAPIHLGLMTGRCFKTHRGLLDDRGTVWLHEGAQNGHAARISFGPDFIVDDGSIQATFLHPLENVILERVQLAGAGYLSLVGNRLRFLQPLSDGFSISPQFLGNLCNAHSSFSHLMDHVKLPILDHVVSLLRGESAVKVGNFQPVILGILTPFSTVTTVVLDDGVEEETRLALAYSILPTHLQPDAGIVLSVYGEQTVTRKKGTELVSKEVIPIHRAYVWDESEQRFRLAD